MIVFIVFCVWLILTGVFIQWLNTAGDDENKNKRKVGKDGKVK